MARIQGADGFDRKGLTRAIAHGLVELDEPHAARPLRRSITVRPAFREDALQPGQSPNRAAQTAGVDVLAHDERHIPNIVA